MPVFIIQIFHIFNELAKSGGASRRGNKLKSIRNQKVCFNNQNSESLDKINK